MNYSNFAQRELDAVSFAEDDKRRAAAVKSEWTAAEIDEFDRLSRKANTQSISMRGNTTFEALARQADAIADAVRRRAAAKMIAAANAPAMQHAAE